MTVSIITATWQRHQLLLERCIPSVAAQSVPVEHIVVCDGPDPELRELLADVPVRYAEVPEHHDNPGTLAWGVNLGDGLATGEYIGICDDDNALRPDHARLLSEALDAHPEADFAYSRVVRHGCGDIIGAEPPRFGFLDGNGLMWRKGVLERFGYWPTDTRTPDWGLVSTWLGNGARWVFVPEVTVDYYYHPGSMVYVG